MMPLNRRLLLNPDMLLLRQQQSNIDALHQLKRLVEITTGKAEAVSTPENVSSFVQDVMKQQAETNRQQEIINCANVASELVGFVESKEASINEKIDTLKLQIQALKNQLKDYKEAKEYGKATSNYLPLAALIIPEQELRQAGVTMEERKIPKVPKIKKS